MFALLRSRAHRSLQLLPYHSTYLDIGLAVVHPYRSYARRITHRAMGGALARWGLGPYYREKGRCRS